MNSRTLDTRSETVKENQKVVGEVFEPFEIDGVPLEEGGESVDGMQDASDSTGVGYRLGFQYFGECDACGTVPIWIDGAIVTPIYCNCGRLIITVRRRAK